MQELTQGIVRSKIKGAVVIPNDFSTKLSRGQSADLFIITDGSEVNTANYVQNYAMQIANQWLQTSRYSQNAQKSVINPQIRTWYNQDLNSHYFILPGSLAITMTLIGILLTALVVAREWERGTMEAILSTRVRKIDIVLGKYIPSLYSCFQSSFQGQLFCFVRGLFFVFIHFIRYRAFNFLQIKKSVSCQSGFFRYWFFARTFVVRAYVSDKLNAFNFPAFNKNFASQILYNFY